MNIGIISYGYPPEKIGGAEFQAKKLAQKLSHRKHKVTVFAGSSSNEIIFENPNLKIIKIKYKNIKILRIFLSQLICFLPEIKKSASVLNVLLCYQVNPAGIIGLFSKIMFNIPLITWVRAETEYKSILRKFIFTPLLLKYSTKFIVQTDVIKKELIKIYSNKTFFNKSTLENIVVIPNGVEIRNSPILPYKSRKGVLYVGRLYKGKGIEYLIRAMKGVREILFIIGDGPEKNNLIEMAQGLNIIFLGEIPQEEVFNYMEKTKLLVLPSISDTLPNVILEAMSVGTPVISTKVGGIVDIIEHGKTGFLVEPKNTRQIGKHVEILVKNEDLWNETSINCLKEVEKYSWTNVIEKVEKILLEMN